MTDRPHLSVVVPCHNEEEVLPELIEALVSTLDEWGESYEILIVDDGSTDRTLYVAQSESARLSSLRYLSFSRNFGKEAAMLAGLRTARGTAVVIMDADLQHPPELIPSMVEIQRQGFDQVVAVRDRSHEPPIRRAIARSYYRFVNKVIDVSLEDGAGDFRLLSRRAVDTLTRLPEANRFSKGLFSWIGFPTASIAFEGHARQHGSSRWSYLKLLDYGVDGVMSFNSKPLRGAVWSGIACVLASAFYLAWLLWHYLTHGVDSPGYLTLFAAITIFGGIQLVVLGVIGEYVGRIYHETKGRPSYVVALDSETEDGP
ncbi:glycosyltransferase family 2 protein [Janibacter sp. LM]|uniref:glycosyltransferase family 2 protein n=1 Tax=Janibacter sp. LM TaxID=3144845 RepID=UPI0031F6903A